MESRITAGCFFSIDFTEQSHREKSKRRSTSRLGYQRTDCLQSLAIQIHRDFFSGEKHSWTMVSFFFKHPIGEICASQIGNQSCQYLSWLNVTKKSWRHPPRMGLLPFPKTMATSGKRLLMFFVQAPLEVFKSTCITSLWLNHPFETYDRQILGLSLMVGSIHYDFTS